MAKQLSQVTFVAPTTYSDGTTPLPTPDALTFAVLIDTVNPPVASYAVPAAENSSMPGATITATFAQLGFTPKTGTTYYAAAEATDAAGTSALSNIVSFTFQIVPAAPTNFSVS